MRSTKSRNIHQEHRRQGGRKLCGGKVIKDETRIDLLGNQLVLIAPNDSKLDNVIIGPDFNLARLVGDGRIATADVRAVPVGKYAMAALEKLGCGTLPHRNLQ